MQLVGNEDVLSQISIYGRVSIGREMVGHFKHAVTGHEKQVIGLAEERCILCIPFLVSVFFYFKGSDLYLYVISLSITSRLFGQSSGVIVNVRMTSQKKIICNHRW